MAQPKTGLDKLQALVDLENKLVKHEVEIKGIDFTFWTRPTSMAQYKAAKAAAKDPDDTLETTARLFIKNALDENGKPQFAIDALPVLMSQLSITSAIKLLNALSDEEEEAYSGLDMKSTKGAAK